jgi:ABC-2 type transport system permease protein
MINRILSLILKETITLLKDKRARTFLILPPLMQLFIFTFAASLDVKNVSMGILNRDDGLMSVELIERFTSSPTFNQITFLSAVHEIAPFIENQKGMLVLFIDQQFSKNIQKLKPASLQLILDGRKSNTAQIVGGYVKTIIQDFNNEILIDSKIPTQNTVLVGRNWFNPNLIYYWYNIPSLVGVLTMLVGLIVTALSIARERETGTFDQLMVSPLRPIEILLGKSIPAILISLAEATIIIMVGIFIFQVPFRGSLLLLYFSLFVFVSSIVGIGLFISSLSSTQQQAILGTFLFMSPSVSLSGFATPIENMPDWLQQMTYLIPLRYILVISKGIFLKEMPWEIAFQNIWPMALIALFTLSGATYFFRKRME